MVSTEPMGTPTTFARIPTIESRRKCSATSGAVTRVAAVLAQRAVISASAARPGRVPGAGANGMARRSGRDPSASPATEANDSWNETSWSAPGSKARIASAARESAASASTSRSSRIPAKPIVVPIAERMTGTWAPVATA